jgi:tRNA 2-thiouridine synthesizing protein A
MPTYNSESTERTTMDITRELDTRGLNCPLPILKAKKTLAEMSTGQTLKIIATDPGSMRDFQAFAKQTGNELVEQVASGDEFTIVLRRR